LAPPWLWAVGSPRLRPQPQPGGTAAGIDVKGELECLALTIYFEARGEADEGKLAVGHVVMNRAQHPLFPRRARNTNRP
jgi:hypothetical protein